MFMDRSALSSHYIAVAVGILFSQFESSGPMTRQTHLISRNASRPSRGLGWLPIRDAELRASEIQMCCSVSSGL